MNCTVYMITHIGSHRSYVGVTRNSMEKRWEGHQLACSRGAEQEMYRLMREEGLESFHLRVIATCSGWEAAVLREAAEIARRKTYRPHGFNGVTGQVRCAIRNLKKEREIGIQGRIETP